MAYSQKEIDETFTLICNELKKGRSLRSVLKDNNMPNSETFYKWVDSSEAKTKQYARACEERADAIFEEMIDIADDRSKDTVHVKSKSGKEYAVEDKEWTNRSRLRVDTRKWMLSKMMPKKYGDKLDVTSDGEKLVAPIINVLPLSDESQPEAK